MSSLSVDGIRMNHHVAGRGPVLVAHPGGPGFDYACPCSPELEKHFNPADRRRLDRRHTARLHDQVIQDHSSATTQAGMVSMDCINVQ
ncbi:hypothetical protein M2271_007162 [Streptomyces sp. LBL]|uniref:hypothetical protein n=1 Tax=Streptomyces sp. LBL TaxID=2940562 RepID=UPI002475F75E|nr:hypothetical protein [Streptomyces sp. LBL]MDH6629326.1 hypothetical protein [Streptomyces sp. LBL]